MDLHGKVAVVTGAGRGLGRAYALALGAGTQTLTQGIGEALFGTTDLSTAVSVGSGWVINAAVAEWVIRRPTGPLRIRPAAVGSR